MKQAPSEHVPYAGLMGVESGEERGAGGAAAARVVELGEAQAFPGHAVEIGRLNLTAVATDVAEAHVINQHNDDVRGAGEGLRADERRQQQ